LWRNKPPHAIQSKYFQGLVADMKVAAMRGVEGPTQYTDTVIARGKTAANDCPA